MRKKFHWAVVGAGPAGIAAIGKLLDQGVKGENIAWIDPTFTVGDFGALWQRVPSNTKVELFLKFLHASEAFSYALCKEDFALNHAPRDKTCDLKLMFEPLQWVTNTLKTKVATIIGNIELVSREKDNWHLYFSDLKITAQQVILAIGAEPKSLALAKPEIPLKDALDCERLSHHFKKNETIAVFGSSHSAILVLKNLIEQSQQVINFYRSPLLYAVYHEDYILYDDTGLKGTTAEWAKVHLEEKLPVGLQRVYSNEENIKTFLPQCDKVIYAIGFQRRSIKIEGVDQVNETHPTGMIAPGLFGFGIAYPEAKKNLLGMLEHRVGLWKFMDYLERVLPIWMRG